MLLALRWKHERIRKAIAITAIVVIIMLTALLFWYYATIKKIVIVIDGQERAIETRTNTLRNVLAEQAITVRPHDMVSRPLTAAISDGERVIIERTLPICIISGSKKRMVYTTKKTVDEALVALQVPIGLDDKVFPDRKSAIQKGMKIRIMRIRKKLEQRMVKTPYQIIKRADDTMLQGTMKLIQPGHEGLVIQKVQNVSKDGKFIFAKFMGKYVYVKPKNKVIAYGTKKNQQVKLQHTMKFNYKKVLNNFQLTAYTEKVGSPGVRTASGTIVSEGRTIAVDPKVVPLGWWVYIDKIGFRRAEDTGGAVKGKIIDVYYKSNHVVRKFGRKKGYRVYVVGPVKPKTGVAV